MLREQCQLEQKTADGKNSFFKALTDRSWFTSKSYSWLKKITLEMVMGQQMKEDGLDQNY